MNSKPKRVVLRLSSILMLLAALPMLLWCLNLIDNAALILPPLFLLTTLYLFGVGWREKRDCKQQ